MNKQSRFKKNENTEYREVTQIENFVLKDQAENQIFKFSDKSFNCTKEVFLSNFKMVNTLDEENVLRTVLMLIFYDKQGEWTVSYLRYDPYFLIKTPPNKENEVLSFIEKRFERKYSGLKSIDKIDLEVLNHLSGKKAKYLKLSFDTISQMSLVRNELKFRIERRQKTGINKENSHDEVFDWIEDIREFDVSYSSRVCIDFDIRVSFWYTVIIRNGFITKINKKEEIIERPDFSILAFDIETTKLPLKFPDARIDAIMMISYMIDGEAFLLLNKEIVAGNVKSFDYSPTSDIECSVNVYSEKDEKEVLLKFFAHIKQTKPLILVTFNGDSFDFPFIIKRAEINGLDIEKELGIITSGSKISKSDEDEQKKSAYQATSAITHTGKVVFLHMDCYYWVKRDAFLPQGSHGLKAVTKAKLGYKPFELDPELMLPLATSDPQRLCEYSVSDAVATYYLYIKHIHDFIFALCSIIPMSPDDVLRRGSGTLCEHLLMAEAYKNGIVFPNKKNKLGERFYQGHLIESETYVGGYVECLNNGVYRSDLQTDFKLSPEKYSDLIENVENILNFYIQVENQKQPAEYQNLVEVRNQIQEKLINIQNQVISENTISLKPQIYHVDVASMYPNIILTNRLQPTAIVNDKICSNCLFNESKNKCKREMGWDWKGVYFPLSRIELENLKLNKGTQNLTKELKSFCQTHYKQAHRSVVEFKENTVCMRENPFYVDTIRAFRDRRYRFKELAKNYSRAQNEIIKNNGSSEKLSEAKMLTALYESQQLAHKIILNSFYGYVMKKGARWYSMEMAAMVTHVGAKIIQKAKGLLDLIGKPLELDTDGVWTLFPFGFPERFELTGKGGKLNISFPCALMNWLIYDEFKNVQYQTPKQNGREYDLRNEMTIFFEIDGPYKAMIIPASREEDKKLKKRYVVFDSNDKITEIKGFEIKRRGELGIIKIFQSEIFHQFLKGHSLKELYDNVASTARKWIQLIKDQGVRVDDEYLIELLCECKVLSRSIDDYGSHKGIALTSAKRLSEFLGPDVLKGTGLNCSFIVSKKPEGAPLNERAVPIAVFSLEKQLRDKLLTKWLKLDKSGSETLKSILDWNYYFERLAHGVQKIVVIPAILQGLENPLPEIQTPDWLTRKLRQKTEINKQTVLNSYFTKLPKTIADIENLQLKQTHPNEKQSGKKQRKTIEFEIENEKDEQQVNTNLSQIENLRKKWIVERNRRKNESILKIKAEDNNLSSFFQNIESRIKNATWNIIKIESTEEGILSFWLVIDRAVMTSRKIHIKRRLYVNSLKDDPTKSFKVSNKKLPREKTSYFLYEYNIEENQFLHKLNNLEYFLTNPDIEGLYESQVPLCFRAISTLGNSCKINSSFPMKTPNIIEFESLMAQTGSAQLSFFHNDQQKKIFFIWCYQKKNKVMSVLINSDNNLYITKILNYEEEQSVKHTFKNLTKNSFFKIFPDIDPQVNVTNVSNFEGLIASMKMNFSECKPPIHTPIIIITMTNCQQFSQWTKQLKNEHPIIELNLEGKTVFNSLEWQKIFMEKSIQDFSESLKTIETFDQLSIYTEIPICCFSQNIENSFNFALDTLLSRELDKLYNIWWYSSNGNVDLGCPSLYSGEDFEETFESECFYIKPTITKTYVFEIDVAMFHFNAFVDSANIDEFETELGFNTTQTNNTRVKINKYFSNNTGASNRIGFKAIRDLFLKFYKESTLNQNQSANLLLRNLIGWISSEKSRFYDPIIKQTLERIVKKTFQLFIKRLEGLGAFVIFASPYKLFVDTKRYTYNSSYNFMNFVLQTIVKDPLFSYLILGINREYKMMMFYDLYNYSGVCLHQETESQINSEIEKARPPLSLLTSWKFIEVLPLAVNEYFYKLLNHYLSEYLSHVYEEDNAILDQDEEDKIAQKMDEYLMTKFSIELYELVKYIKEQSRLFEYKHDEKFNKPIADIPIVEHNQDENNEDFQNDDSYEKDSFLDDDESEEEEEILETKKELPLKKRNKKKKENDQKDNKLIDWKCPDFIGSRQKNDNERKIRI